MGVLIDAWLPQAPVEKGDFLAPCVTAQTINSSLNGYTKPQLSSHHWALQLCWPQLAMLLALPNALRTFLFHI